MKLDMYKVIMIFFCITTCVLILTYNSLCEDRRRKHNSSQTSGMKYILQWTNSNHVPFIYMKRGQSGFIERGCPHVNCFVTDNRTYFPSYTEFDVVIFSGPEVVLYPKSFLPSKRSPHQKYVFVALESAANYPACTNLLNGYFNWTWSYRLDSDVKWGYIVVRNLKNEIIGPKIDMHWMKVEDMSPLSEESKRELGKKSKAAIWFVSNCYSASEREYFVKKLQIELDMYYNLVVDVFGDCGPHTCPRDKESECDKKIKDYYFYLAFENAFSEDYVTEKLLRGLNNDAVPIVYGGANYTRFMPDDIYLNAAELGVKKLAAKMNELIKDPYQYQEYFKWKNHYKYHLTTSSLETNEYCKFCSLLNNEDMLRTTTVVENFVEWWTPQYACVD